MGRPGIEVPGRISVAKLLGGLGIDRQTRSRLVRGGWVSAYTASGPGGPAYYVDEAEALRVRQAAMIASSAGTALSTTLRVLMAASEVAGEVYGDWEPAGSDQGDAPAPGEVRE